jgi:hypothetical protein
VEICARLYRPRRARESPLFRLVEQHLEEFLRVYPVRVAVQGKGSSMRRGGAKRPGRGHTGALAWLVEGLEGVRGLSPLTSATETTDSTSYRSIGWERLALCC